MKIIRIAFLLGAVQILSAQQTEPRAHLEGIVVKSGTNQPLSKAIVALRANAASVATTMTDDDGRFLFPNVNPGQYRLLAERRGYIAAEYGQRSVEGPGLVIDLSSRQRLTAVRVEMTQGASISGRVTDRGLSVGGVVRVFALRASTEAGQRLWTEALATISNDLGEYHLSWLPPGRYYVLARVPDGPSALGSRGLPDVRMHSRPVFVRNLGAGTSDTEMHVPVFFPNTSDWKSARAVDVGPGGTAINVDIDASPRPALRIRGVVSGIPAGSTPPPGATVGRGGRGLAPAAQPRVTLIPLDSVSIENFSTVTADEKGAFEISRVPPGSYALLASIGNNFEARANVEVRDRDVNGVVLIPSQQIVVSGRIVIEGQSPESNLANRLRVALVPTSIPGSGLTTPNPALGGVGQSLSLSLVTPTATGSFSIQRPVGEYRVFVGPILTLPLSSALPAANVPPALHSIATRPPELSKLYVKSIRLGNTDVLANGLRLTAQTPQQLEIVIGNNPGSVQGRVVNTRNQPSPATTVVLIPESGLRFRTNHAFAVTDASGRFEIADVPPGAYKAFAWEQVEMRAWQDPDFLRQYESQGKLVQINEGGKPTIDMTSIPQ
jgi:hypothetical protein